MFETPAAVSRRQFLTQAGSIGALYSLAAAFPLRGLASGMAGDDPRISQTPLVDAGFASVRKIGEGLYATISDTSKGITTMCNGGFLFGKDAALLVEGFVSGAGAAFQMDALRKVAQVPATGAVDTHYHFDHSLGNAYYAGNGIQLWAHAAVPKRIAENYSVMQGADRAVFVAPFEKRVKDAKSDVQKQHAESDLRAIGNVFDLVNKAALTLPNRLLDPAKLPLNVDLGHFPVVIESYPGHSGTDLVVRIPDQKVVYTGDLIFNHAYPATFDERATISGWRATLKTFASWDKDTIFVPGHGPLCGQDGVQHLRDVFDDISEHAEKMHKAGVPVTEAAERYAIPEKFQGMAMFAWGFCIAPAITKLYAEWEKK
jgi:glyoxylase-like metal-dependent hydrolase (beta-lactamase superfamily II)